MRAANPLTWRGDPSEIVAAEADAEHLVRRLRSLRPEWHGDAACIGEPVETFFPPRGGTNEPALAICAGCPARRSCLAEALADPTLNVAGIRGGMTAKARRLTGKARARGADR